MNNPLPKAGPDFLQRLVHKALGEGSEIEPRLPSIFEPASSSSLDAGISWQGASAQVTAAAMDDRADEGGQGPGRSRADVNPTPIFGRDSPGAATAPGDFEPAPSAKQPAVSHELDVEPPVSTAVPHRRAVEAATRRSPTASLEHLQPRAAHFMTQEPRPFAGDEHPAAGRRSPDGFDRGEISPLLAGDSRLAGMQERADPSMRADLDDSRGTLVPFSAAAQQRIVVALPTAPYRPMHDEASIERAAAPATPIVNVTIGRLEVRALPPAAATAKPRIERRGPQPMTLDDYLKQQQGKR